MAVIVMGYIFGFVAIFMASGVVYYSDRNKAEYRFACILTGIAMLAFLAASVALLMK